MSFISGPAVPPARRGTRWTGLAHSSDWYHTVVEGLAGGKVPANRCDPSNGNKGCDEQEVKYIEKINKHYAELVRASNHHKTSEPKSV